MKILPAALVLLALSGCATIKPPTAEEKARRANTTEFVHIGDQVMILRYDEKGELLP